MGKYIKRPTPVEAWQYVGVENPDPKFEDGLTTAQLETLGAPIQPAESWGDNHAILVTTINGSEAICKPGDWIARQPLPTGGGWDWWPIDGAQFHLTYEKPDA